MPREVERFAQRPTGRRHRPRRSATNREWTAGPSNEHATGSVRKPGSYLCPNVSAIDPPKRTPSVAKRPLAPRANSRACGLCRVAFHRWRESASHAVRSRKSVRVRDRSRDRQHCGASTDRVSRSNRGAATRDYSRRASSHEQFWIPEISSQSERLTGLNFNRHSEPIFK
jgi:hypothetical protein